MSKRFSDLVGVMARLRGKDGCPWDREQTPETLKPFLIEEAYEVLEAIDARDPAMMKEELGDLLFQVVFHSQIAAERGEFGIEGVLAHTIAKMTRRHPHVFGPGARGKPKKGRPSSGEVLARWEDLKRKEKGNQKRTSVLDGVPKTLPALMRAHLLQSRASRVGFDWKSMRPVWAKVREEIRELEEAVKTGRAARIQDEFGDVFFALVNLARFMKLDPEESLRRANNRFTDRFQYVERHSGRPLQEMTPAEMDGLWEKAKKVRRRKSGRSGRSTSV
ncbi:MAG TPA: nucleoside triphosphate pyrophosphohydrolase [Nitrospiria bacterium]